MRDLPIPGSPEISTTEPSPDFACVQRRIRSSISSSRPTNGVVAVRSASKRLSTELARKGHPSAHRPVNTFEFLCAEVSQLEEIPEKFSRCLADDHHSRL